MATKQPVCAPAWFEDPRVLITDSWISQWKRRSTGRPPCFSERINALTRTFLVVIAVALVFSLYNNDLVTTMTYSLVLGLLITLPDIIDMIKAPYIQSSDEGFVTQHTSSPSPFPKSVDSNESNEDMTLPTPRNPFMNVLIDEIKYNPTRAEAAPIDSPTVKATLDDFFRVQWFSDPTDVFGKSQSQRQFITMPSSTIPNDRESLQNWLYKIPGKTCKEGGREACVGATDGGVLPWLNFN